MNLNAKSKKENREKTERKQYKPLYNKKLLLVRKKHVETSWEVVGNGYETRGA